MKVRPVDPRDQRWEDHRPVFRAVFQRFRESIADDSQPSLQDEWELTNADVHEVILWARKRLADFDAWELYLLVDDRDGVGVVHLLREHAR